MPIEQKDFIKLIDKIYNKLSLLPTPNISSKNIDYYGKDYFFERYSNMLEITKNIRDLDDILPKEYNPNKCYALKVGNSYRYSDYSDILMELCDYFNPQINNNRLKTQVIKLDDLSIVGFIYCRKSNYSIYGVWFKDNC